MSFLIFIIVFVLIAIDYIVIISFSSASLADVKSAQKDPNTSAVDQQHYKEAAQYLGWSIAIGWTIFAIAIVVIIIAIVLLVLGAATGVDEVAAGVGMAGEATLEADAFLSQAKTVASKAKDAYNMYNNLHKASQTLKTGPKEIKEGLFGFNNFFNWKGWAGKFECIAIILMLGANFAFGILAAEAAAKINKTTDKAGYSSAIWATVLGIIPFAVVVIWWFANIFYVHGAKTRYANAEHLVEENRYKLKEAKIQEHKTEIKQVDQAIIAGVASGTVDPIKAKQALSGHTTPRRPAPPPPGSAKGSSSSIAGYAASAQKVYQNLTPEQQAQLKQGASSALNYALKAFSSATT